MGTFGPVVGCSQLMRVRPSNEPTITRQDGRIIAPLVKVFPCTRPALGVAGGASHTQFGTCGPGGGDVGHTRSRCSWRMLKAQQFPTARPQRVSAETRPRDDSVSGSGPAHCEGG